MAYVRDYKPTNLIIHHSIFEWWIYSQIQDDSMFTKHTIVCGIRVVVTSTSLLVSSGSCFSTFSHYQAQNHSNSSHSYCYHHQQASCHTSCDGHGTLDPWGVSTVFWIDHVDCRAGWHCSIALNKGGPNCTSARTGWAFRLSLATIYGRSTWDWHATFTNIGCGCGLIKKPFYNKIIINTKIT